LFYLKVSALGTVFGVSALGDFTLRTVGIYLHTIKSADQEPQRQFCKTF
jgi:hypothetical protein